MNGGLDQQIQQKVDAYRGNPQALMQRYQQNQQLLDLLALQKLKSEKEAAARQMQMQMQQQPQTVAQQREQEVLGLTKQELAQQTQGIMQQRQAQQQKNLQQVAQGGIGALLQRPQAAPQPVPRMAGGGIVAFQPGGQVEAATPFGRWLGRTTSQIGEDFDLQRLRQRVQMKYGTKASPLGAFRRQTDEERARAQEILRDLPTMSREQLEMLLVDDMSDVGRPAGVPEDYQPGTITQFGPEGAGPKPMPTPPQPEPPAGGIVDLGVIDIPAEQQNFVRPAPGGPGQLPAAEVESLEPPAPDADAGGGAGGGGIASLGLGGPEAAMRRGFATADEYLGRGEKAAKFAEMEQRLAALDEAQYDPAEERRDQLKAFLLGAGGQSTAAGALGAAGRASMSLRADQKSARRKRLMDQFDLAKAGMVVDVDLGKAGLQLGQEMFAQAAANQRAAVSAATTLRTTELNAAIRRGELEYEKLRDDRDFGLREKELEAERAATAARQRTTDLDAITQGMDRMLGITDDITERMYSAAGLDMLAMQITGARDEEARAIAEAEYARRKAEADASVQTVLNRLGVLDALEGLQGRLAEIGEFSAPMPSLEDIADIEYREE
jgi:hypothetical protein